MYRNQSQSMMAVLNFVNSCLPPKCDLSLQEHYTKHMRTMRLVNIDDSFVRELQGVEGVIKICAKVDRQEAIDFVFEVATAMGGNPYFERFLSVLQGSALPNLKEKIFKSLPRELPSIIAYGVLLDRITRLIRANPQMLRALINYWRCVRSECFKFSDYGGLFNYIKLLSVESAGSAYLDALEGQESLRFLRRHLALNIMEATVQDCMVHLNFDNAMVGAGLAQQLGVFGMQGSKNSSSDFKWSSDGKCVSIEMDQSIEYANLYSVWNFAFISNYFDWPYLCMKLLIPQVSNYSDCPQEYKPVKSFSYCSQVPYPAKHNYKE